jgi:hypothetical protein
MVVAAIAAKIDGGHVDDRTNKFQQRACFIRVSGEYHLSDMLRLLWIHSFLDPFSS